MYVIKFADFVLFRMLRSFLLFYFYFDLVIISCANLSVINGNLNTLLFTNTAYLNCPLKKLRLLITFNHNGDDIIRQLPCRNNVEQFKELFEIFIKAEESIKRDLLIGWSQNNRCKALLSITDAVFSVANLTINTCCCFVDTENGAITRSSFEIVKTCELLMQKFQTCHHINDLMGDHRTRQFRHKRSDSQLLMKFRILYT